MAKVALDKRIADEPLRRPRIGKLPTPPAIVDEIGGFDGPVPEEAGDDAEVTENLPARVIIRREPPIRK